MCLILFAIDSHPQFPLVLAANRDEYYARPSRALQPWPEAPRLIGGKDLEAGGTWLGVTAAGRFAAVTNVREGVARERWERSRGELARDFLLGEESAGDYARRIYAVGEQFAGFNLLVGDGEQIHYCSNKGDAPRALGAGVYGLSNDTLDTPWPKVESGKAALSELLRGSPNPTALLQILADTGQPADSELPDTGVGLTLERVYASRFIATPLYGTRASTALLFDIDGGVTLWEQSFSSGGQAEQLIHFHDNLKFHF